MDELTADLPVEEILIELPKENLICDKCGGTFVMIGKKFVNQEIQAIPRRCKLVKYYSCTYACKSCEEKTGVCPHLRPPGDPPGSGMGLIWRPPLQWQVLMTRKYVDGLPLARQEKSGHAGILTVPGHTGQLGDSGPLRPGTKPCTDR